MILIYYFPDFHFKGTDVKSVSSYFKSYGSCMFQKHRYKPAHLHRESS